MPKRSSKKIEPVQQIETEEEEVDYSGKLLWFRTIHSGDFKTLFDVLKDAIYETNLTFVKPRKKYCEATKEYIDIGGIRINDVTKDQTMYVHINIKHTSFQDFYCGFEGDTYDVSVTVKAVNDFLKTIDKEGTLTGYVNEKDREYIHFKFEDHACGATTCYRIKLVDCDGVEDPPNGSIRYDMAVKISTQEFHKTCRELSNISTVDPIISIECCKDYVKFKTESKEKTISMEKCFDNIIGSVKSKQSKQQKSGVCIVMNDKLSKRDPVFNEKYRTKYILYFSKCTSFCNNVTLGLTNKQPIFISYKIASIGEMVVSVGPTQDEEYDDDRDYDLEDYISEDEYMSDDDE